MKKNKGLKTKKKGMLVKVGSPLPGEPAAKLHSAHLTEKSFNKAEHDLLEGGKIKETIRVRVPKQSLLYGRKKPRITPRRPRIR